MLVPVVKIPKPKTSWKACFSNWNLGFHPVAIQNKGIAITMDATELNANDQTPAPANARINESSPDVIFELLLIKAIRLKSIFLVNWALWTKLTGLDSIPKPKTGRRLSNIGSL